MYRSMVGGEIWNMVYLCGIPGTRVWYNIPGMVYGIPVCPEARGNAYKECLYIINSS